MICWDCKSVMAGGNFLIPTQEVQCYHCGARYSIEAKRIRGPQISPDKLIDIILYNTPEDRKAEELKRLRPESSEDGTTS